MSTNQLPTSVVSVFLPPKIAGRRTIISLFLIVFPATVLSETITISEEMPATIPTSIAADWEQQDGTNYAASITKIKKSIPQEYANKITGSGKTGYLNACHWRRIARMKPYRYELQKVLFSRHYNLGGMIIGYLEDLNADKYTNGIGEFGNKIVASKGTNYASGAALCVITMKNYYPTPVDILTDTKGVVRDPCVSYDGKRIVFAWSKDNNGYHLFEMEVDNPKNIRQLTSDPTGLTVSDFEPCYLPDDNIVFNSSRCFAHVDCDFGVVSNLFMINKDGKYLRQIGFDQVHTLSPTMMDDGRVLYSRWEYNDRSVSNSCGLFTMNPDGCAQMEFFGNQTDWPAMIYQGRQIPNSSKIMAIFSGLQAPYAGEVGIISPEVTRNGANAVQLIAPLRKNPKVTINTSVEKIGKYYLQNPYPVDGNVKYLFQNPYPFDEDWFLISWRPSTTSPYKEKFKIYFMNKNGERELLAWNQSQSVSQPMPLYSRVTPQIPKYQTNYAKSTARMTIQDVYTGLAMDSTVTKGSVKKIRVIALDYKPDPAFGDAGANMMPYTMTPVARWTGSWEAKRILGETPVESDGSAAFLVPAREPVFIQLIDEEGRMVQTMRSWMTLQPGEVRSCVGCHENKNEAPTTGKLPIATEVKELEPFFDIANSYLYYPDQIQPILDKNCVKANCHNQKHKSLDLRGDKLWTGTFNDKYHASVNRYWSRSYWNLTKSPGTYVDWISIFGKAEGLAPYPPGSSTSRLIRRLISGGHKDLAIPKKDIAKLCAWIDLCIPHSGSYADDMKPEDQKKWLKRMERGQKHRELEKKNIEDFIHDGGYNIPIDLLSTHGNTFRSSCFGDATLHQRFTVDFLMNTRQIAVSLPSEGKIMLLDIMGHKLVTVAVNRNMYLKNARKIIPVNNIPAGLYIVNFIGTFHSERQIIPIM